MLSRAWIKFIILFFIPALPALLVIFMTATMGSNLDYSLGATLLASSIIIPLLALSKNYILATIIILLYYTLIIFAFRIDRANEKAEKRYSQKNYEDQ